MKSKDMKTRKVNEIGRSGFIRPASREETLRDRKLVSCLSNESAQGSTRLVEVRSLVFTMSLRSPADNEMPLTLALSHRNGRGDSSAQLSPDPARVAGRGEGLVARPSSYFEEAHEAFSRGAACCAPTTS